MYARISSSCRQELVAAGTVTRTLAFMQRFAAAELFSCVWGCQFLNSLVDDAATAASVRGCDVFPVILPVLRDHVAPDAAALHFQGCQLIGSLLAKHGEVDVAKAQGMWRVVLKTAEKWPSNEDLQEFVWSIMSFLVEGDAEFRSALVNAGGINLMMMAMAAHPHNANLQTVSCAVMLHLVTLEPRALAVLKRLQAKALVDKARRNHPSGPPQLRELAAALSPVL
jgi:hypothetical protein